MIRSTGFALVALMALVGCKPAKLSTKGCNEDKDCGEPVSAYRCEMQTGTCYCRTNAACLPREFCNPAGFCQDRSGCEKNSDCLDPSLFCDTSTGTCLSKGRCTSDLQCALGQVCDLGKATCVDGCHTSGDCPGSSCRCGDQPCLCSGSNCQVGECDPYFCADESFCKFGEKCGIPPDAGLTRNTCYSDFDNSHRPYCATCTNGGGTDTCGTGANYCITDTRTRSTYCGADCSGGESCPRGYGCRDIIVVFTRWACGPGTPCPADPALPCASDAECKRGGTCVKGPGMPNGFCSGVCRVREGSSFGFCSCQVDFDCAQESCAGGECTISRKKCITEQDCRPIRCVDFQNAGGCLIGQNCTPANGLTCVEVE
jgi:hypothetical protein